MASRSPAHQSVADGAEASEIPTGSTGVPSTPAVRARQPPPTRSPRGNPGTDHEHLHARVVIRVEPVAYLE